MIEPSGAPKVIEFNARFGDPETQPLVVRMNGDLAPLLEGAARGRLDPGAAPAFDDAAVCVVLASGGYPRSYETGKPIEGLDEVASDPNVTVFHAGTARDGEVGFRTAGGRVLAVTARGTDVSEARERAYAAAARIRFDGVYYRRDVAARAVS
jgi:phosphoribosylamine--glycine ligase